MGARLVAMKEMLVLVLPRSLFHQPQVESAAQAQPVVVTTPGYSYDEPEVTLPVRPVTQAPTTRAPTTPAALYGAPARTGRRLNNRRNRKQGRRVKNKRRVVFV